MKPRRPQKASRSCRQIDADVLNYRWHLNMKTIVCLASLISFSIGIAHAQKNASVAIDFKQCKPHRERVYVDFGSTTYEIVGPRAGVCVMRYGGEIENPKWDGSLPITCKIPRKLGP